MKKFTKYLLVLVGIVFLAGCEVNSTDSVKSDLNIDTDENISVKTYIANSNEGLIVVLNNEFDYNIGSFDLEVVYYDESGNKIEEDSTTVLDFKSGNEYVTMFDLPKDAEYNYYVPEKINVTVKVDEEYQEMVELRTMYNDKIDISYIENEEDISVTIKNNSGVDLQTVEVAVMFMKNNKPVMLDSLNGCLDIGESTTEEIDIPIDWEKSEEEDVFIDYDSIKFVVNRAVAEY